ncbi:unnamed protein product (macronuclear) [Paramecium tetraurelia]|uniref:Uncharacterized protein n=1 Tax=Paramecium tetraurelia TaxID=5888 RepID=A0D9X3_PARTE|nr:uncharacterized protein GSPATT00014772001 [Paramecium tetraurelia]CAK79840.1 unnamed protein product [Paramecium tetraurelia]|eukprot:XP_001447237.1 hypothetical protein (macronuclear) [Paramecium tetraurelia strain d4-2]
MFDIQIIKEGIGDTPRLHEEVFFFFIAHNQNGELLTNSQHTATKTIIGRGWLQSEIEQALSKMKQGERSLIKIYQSPVSKEFYNQYEIEIIRIGRMKNNPWHLEGEEVYERALELKGLGNGDIKQQQYLEAQNKYLESLNLIKTEYCDRELELQGQLRSNLSLTYLKNKQFELCIKQATNVLQGQPENVKLLHRRAVASIQVDDFERAKVDLKLANQLDPQNEEVIKELQSIGEKEKQIKKKQQERAKRMLFGE